MSDLSQRMLNKYYPLAVHPFNDLLAKSMMGCEKVLDAGCGDGRIYQYSFKDQTTLLVGLDSRSDLVENQQVHCATRASVVNLPFASQSFNLIFSRFVLEHLKTPQTCFMEFARVLKPGGKLIILTPNRFHYFSLAGTIIPHQIQRSFARLVNYKDEDTFPTYYRANTRRVLKNLGEKAALKLDNVILYEPCPYFLSFSPITLAPAILYERLINYLEIMSNLRAHIVAVFRKYA